MDESGLVGLENTISSLPGVLGCVILSGPDGGIGEIQAFTRSGLDPDAVEGLIAAEVGRMPVQPTDGFNIRVFELDAESFVGDRTALEQAAEIAVLEAADRPLEESPQQGWRFPWAGLTSRPVLHRVVLNASTSTNEAEVSLEADQARRAVGAASGQKTQYGLRVLADATLKACQRLIEGFRADVLGVSLVSVAGEEAVLVVMRLDEESTLSGSALVRGGPVSEAAVRATLDALNRVLLRP